MAVALFISFMAVYKPVYNLKFSAMRNENFNLHSYLQGQTSVHCRVYVLLPSELK